MRGGHARHCAFLLGSIIFGIPRKIFKWLSKDLQKPGMLVWLCVVLWYGSLSSWFLADAILQSQCFGLLRHTTQDCEDHSQTPGVLWQQYVTYASSCIMTKASSGYWLMCTHFVCHILEGNWLFALGVALIKSSKIIYWFYCFFNSGIPRYICQ